jgi:hypothetical protein
MCHEFLTVQIRSAKCTCDKVAHDARVELLVASVCVEGAGELKKRPKNTFNASFITTTTHLQSTPEF